MAIIKTKFNAYQTIELTNVLRNMLVESIECGGDIEWYREASMDDYFNEYQEIWDGDTRIGEGIDTISSQFVLNDETREDFEICFNTALDEAIKEVEENEL